MYIKKGEYQGSEMTIGNVYEVIGVEADYYRIIDDNNEPFLYSPLQFKIIDPKQPDFWVTEKGEDGESYSYPFSWLKEGYFEDFHDNNKSVIKHFWSECERLYEITKNV